MKEVMAFIRPRMVVATKKALEELGFPGITASAVQGRGRQRGIANEVSFPIKESLIGPGRIGGMKFIPKRMIQLMAEDDQIDEIVDTIVKVNQTAQVGDGKIFVCPIDDALRVRTGETGDSAL